MAWTISRNSTVRVRRGWTGPWKAKACGWPIHVLNKRLLESNGINRVPLQVDLWIHQQIKVRRFVLFVRDNEVCCCLVWESLKKSPVTFLLYRNGYLPKWFRNFWSTSLSGSFHFDSDEGIYHDVVSGTCQNSITWKEVDSMLKI